MSPTAILVWAVALIALEVLHLKWIVWEYWTCSSCGTEHKHCGHMPVWAKLL